MVLPSKTLHLLQVLKLGKHNAANQNFYCTLFAICMR